MRDLPTVRHVTAQPASRIAALFAGRICLVHGTTVLHHEEVTLFPRELDCLEVEGELIRELLPLLDGKHGLGDLVKHLRGRFAVPQIVELLAILASHSIVEGTASENDQSPKVQHGRLAVAIAGQGAGRAELEAALAEHGVAVVKDGQPVPLTVRLVGDYHEITADYAATSSGAMMPVKLAGEIAWFGPIFRPDAGACPVCLEQRLRLTREAYLLSEAHLAERGPCKLAAAAAQVCALQVRQWLDDLAAESHLLLDALATFEPQHLSLELHRVVKRPQCPACGSAEVMLRAPIELGQSADLHGQERDATLFDRCGHHVDALTGLVTALEPVSEHPLNVFRARHVRPFPANTSKRVVEGRRLVAAGKGMSASVARAGALAEALERYSCTWDGTEKVVVASAAELGVDCVLPNDSMLFSDEQLSGGRVDEGYKAGVPAVLDLHAPMGWLKAWSLSHRRWRHVAAGWALMGYRGPGREFSVGDSNGNAAGLSIDEAIMSALCELVERDAVALWWYNRVQRPGVCLDDLPSDYIADMRDHYRQIGREFWVLDLTSDIGIPTFAAVSRCVDGQPAAPAIAFGSHVDPHTAALRAITEMNQVLPHARANAPREDRPVASDERPDSMSLQTLDDHPYIKPASHLPETQLGQFVTPVRARACEQVAWAERQLSAAGLELLVLEQTRPDVGLPVVRVVVPGMRHFWRRFAPGRLYDVPVKMGWLDRALTEAELNPLELAI